MGQQCVWCDRPRLLGQLGYSANFGSTTIFQSTFARVTLGSLCMPKNIACGSKHTTVLLSNSSILTFGNNAYTQLGTTGVNLCVPYNPSIYRVFNIFGSTNTTYTQTLYDGLIKSIGQQCTNFKWQLSTSGPGEVTFRRRPYVQMQTVCSAA